MSSCGVDVCCRCRLTMERTDGFCSAAGSGEYVGDSSVLTVRIAAFLCASNKRAPFCTCVDDPVGGRPFATVRRFLLLVRLGLIDWACPCRPGRPSFRTWKSMSVFAVGDAGTLFVPIDCLCECWLENRSDDRDLPPLLRGDEPDCDHSARCRCCGPDEPMEAPNASCDPDDPDGALATVRPPRVLLRALLPMVPNNPLFFWSSCDCSNKEDSLFPKLSPALPRPFP